MDIIIQCPYCNRMLLRDMRDVLRVKSFYCECHDKGFQVHIKMEIIKGIEKEEEEDEEFFGEVKVDFKDKGEEK